MADGIGPVAVGTIAAGAVLVWTGLRGGSVLTTVQELIKGERPSGAKAKPITIGRDVGGGLAEVGAGVVAGKASDILRVAASKKGQCYVFGAGHSGDPCASRCSDCSSYVCCVLNTATGSNLQMTTAGLAGIGRGVPYDQRQPGDVIVWNGGTGGGHVGIIATVDGRGGQMWNNPCTGCGGVKLSRYPSGSRSASTAVVRRVT